MCSINRNTAILTIKLVPAIPIEVVSGTPKANAVRHATKNPAADNINAYGAVQYQPKKRCSKY